MRTNPLLLGAATTTLALAACETDAGSSGAGPDTVVETIGDTTVVRTVSGSVWDTEATLVPEVSIGELEGPEEYLFGWIWSIAVDDDHMVYVFDEQAQHVRVFDSGGTYVETLGRRGEGPGSSVVPRPSLSCRTADWWCAIPATSVSRSSVPGPDKRTSGDTIRATPTRCPLCTPTRTAAPFW